MLPALLALILLVVAALYMGRAAAGEVPQFIAWGMAGSAAALIVWRVARRR